MQRQLACLVSNLLSLVLYNTVDVLVNWIQFPRQLMRHIVQIHLQLGNFDSALFHPTQLPSKLVNRELDLI